MKKRLYINSIVSVGRIRWYTVGAPLMLPDHFGQKGDIKGALTPIVELPHKIRGNKVLGTS